MAKIIKEVELKIIQERIAYHESGHAVLAYLMGYKVLEIQVFPHKTYVYYGYLVDDSDERPSSLEDAKKSICVCYAGEIAESIKYGSLDAQLSGMGSKDRDKAENLLTEYFPPIEKERQKEMFRKKVRRLLTKKWANVEMLVEILVQDENGCSLKEDEIIQIINHSKQNH